MLNKEAALLSVPMRLISGLLLGPRYLAYTVFSAHRMDGESYARNFSAIYFAGICIWMLTVTFSLPPVREAIVETIGVAGVQFTGRIGAYLVIVLSTLISIAVWWRKPAFSVSVKTFEPSGSVKNPYAAMFFFFYVILMAVVSESHPYWAVGGVMVGLLFSARYAQKKCGPQAVR